MTLPTLSEPTPVITVGGADLPKPFYGMLQEIRVDLSLRLPGKATLRFRDDDYALATNSSIKLGTAVKIEAKPVGGGLDTLISGVIVGVAIEQGMRNMPETVVTVFDDAYKLMGSTTVSSYVEQNYVEILSSIAQNAGLTADVSAPSGQLDYLLQADTNLALVEALAERLGYDWWVADKTLHFCAPDANPRASGDGTRLVLGKNLLELEVRATGLHPASVHVDGWDRTKQQLVSGDAASSTAANRPDADIASSFLDPSVNGSTKLITARVGAQSAPDAKTAAEALNNLHVAAAVVAVGRALNCTALLPGAKVKVVDAGPTSGTYHVTRVEHLYRKGFTTRFTTGERRPTQLVDTVVRASRTAPTLRFSGLLAGKVTNVNPGTSDGRVKVTLPGISELQESSWARVLTPGGGKTRGVVFLPEVGDEVLVGFENGDLAQPVVLGGLFGQDSPIPNADVKDGAIMGRRITSRQGHIIELKDGDADNEQWILLELAGKQHKVNLAKDKAEINVPAGTPLTIKVGDTSTMKFDGSGNVKLEATAITIAATGKLELKGATIEATAQAEFKAEASGSMQVKGALVQVQGSGPVAIKGSPVAVN